MIPTYKRLRGSMPIAWDVGGLPRRFVRPRVLVVLASKLPLAQAQTILGTVRERLAVSNDPDEIAILGSTTIALAATIGTDASHVEVLPALMLMAPRTADAQFLAPDSELGRLTANWTPMQSRLTLLSLLGWSGGPEAQTWAHALIARLPGFGGEQSVLTILDALKYPSATGATGDLLMDALKTIVPGADAPGTPPP
ncbi:MAG: hypothetical protein FJW27_19620 [Acidimicrobiia bacterium]|nr:hypothetical protein [Acidimicrobiia bacterium]